MPLNVNGNIIESTDVSASGNVLKNKVISDGLICYLDAADADSYSGSGTQWTDLSGNGYHGTLVNGATFNSGVAGGVMVTDGTNDYISISTPSLVSTNYTIIGGAKYATVDAGANSYDSGRIFSANLNNWLMGWWNGYTENYYAVGWISAVSSGASDTNWRIEATTGDITKDLYTLYVNGTPTVTNNNGGSEGPNGFSLGRYAIGGTEYANAYISFFLVYNRILERHEISQIYQSFKGRLGLS